MFIKSRRSTHCSNRWASGLPAMVVGDHSVVSYAHYETPQKLGTMPPNLPLYTCLTLILWFRNIQIDSGWAEGGRPEYLSLVIIINRDIYNPEPLRRTLFFILQNIRGTPRSRKLSLSNVATLYKLKEPEQLLKPLSFKGHTNWTAGCSSTNTTFVSKKAQKILSSSMVLFKLRS